MIRDLIIKNRSYRRFHQYERISVEQLKSWIDLARFSASGMNAQSLKYVLITNQEMCGKIFPLVSWAGYLRDWPGPKDGERPAAYIVMLHDKDISSNYFCDDGIAAQSILLGAVESGFGGCIMASVKRESLRKVLNLEDKYHIIQILALGKPKEKVVLDEMKNGNYKYWRDENEVHHVPKRSLGEIILKEEC